MIINRRRPGGSSKPEQTKSVTPSDEVQTVEPDEGYTLSAVTVQRIPSNYGKITYNGFELTVS